VLAALGRRERDFSSGEKEMTRRRRTRGSPYATTADALRALLKGLVACASVLAVASLTTAAKCSHDTKASRAERAAKSRAQAWREGEWKRRSELLAERQRDLQKAAEAAPPTKNAELASLVGAPACGCGAESGRPGARAIWRVRLGSDVLRGQVRYTCEGALGPSASFPAVVEALMTGCDPDALVVSLAYPPFSEPLEGIQ
jgi:hypothetical protein